VSEPDVEDAVDAADDAGAEDERDDEAAAAPGRRKRLKELECE
jgi:hypothetical protein